MTIPIDQVIDELVEDPDRAQEILREILVVDRAVSKILRNSRTDRFGELLEIANVLRVPDNGMMYLPGLRVLVRMFDNVLQSHAAVRKAMRP